MFVALCFNEDILSIYGLNNVRVRIVSLPNCIHVKQTLFNIIASKTCLNRISRSSNQFQSKILPDQHIILYISTSYPNKTSINRIPHHTDWHNIAKHLRREIISFWKSNYRKLATPEVRLGAETTISQKLSRIFTDRMTLLTFCRSN